jgi:hypothetical protein
VPPSHCTTFLISFQIVGIVRAGRFSFIELMRQAETKIVHILQVLSSVADALNLQGGPEFGSSSPLSPYARQDTPSESICSPIRLPRRRPASLVSPSNSASEGDFVQLESLPRLPKELVGPRKIGRSLSDDVERRAGQEVKGSRRSSHRRQDSSKWLTTAELVLTSSRAGDARFSANKVRDSPADSDSPMFGASPAAQSPTDKLPTTLHRLYSVASSPGHRSAQRHGTTNVHEIAGANDHFHARDRGGAARRSKRTTHETGERASGDGGGDFSSILMMRPQRTTSRSRSRSRSGISPRETQINIHTQRSEPKGGEQRESIRTLSSKLSSHGGSFSSQGSRMSPKDHGASFSSRGSRLSTRERLKPQQHPAPFASDREGGFVRGGSWYSIGIAAHGEGHRLKEGEIRPKGSWSPAGDGLMKPQNTERQRRKMESESHAGSNSDSGDGEIPQQQSVGTSRLLLVVDKQCTAIV